MSRKQWTYYWWTLSYFKPYLGLTLIYIILGGLMMFGEVNIPRIMGQLIDGIPNTLSSGLLKWRIGLIAMSILLILVAKSLFNLIQQMLTYRIIKDQQTDLLEKLYQLGYAYYEKVPIGETLSIFENSVSETSQIYTFLFPQFIYNFCQFMVPAMILLSIQPLFFGAVMLGNFLFLWMNRMTNKKILYYQDMESRQASIYQQSLYDALEARPEMKAMCKKGWIVDRTRQAFQGYSKNRLQSILWRHIRYTTVGLTLTLSMILFYWIGAVLVEMGTMTIGQVVACSFLIGLVSRGFSIFIYILPAQMHALNYAGHLYDFMHQEPLVQLTNIHQGEKNVSGQRLKEAIVFENVSFSYGKKQVLKSLNLRIELGKRTAIVGESGCGKSTVLKLIGRFYDPQEGRIMIDGHDLKEMDVEKIRTECGWVFQETFLFSRTIWENIRFGNPKAKEADIIDAAKRAGVDEFVRKLPGGYKTTLEDRGGGLSGGQKQRIALARMFVKKSKLILLDEATSALDNQTESFIKESLEQLPKGSTLVAVAHRLSTIQDYDRILYMADGQVKESGTYESLMQKKGFFYELAKKGEMVNGLS